MSDPIEITQEDLDAKISAAVEAATAKLAAQNEKLLGEVKNARQRVEAFKDYDPDQVKEALEKAKEARKQAADALADRGQYEKALKTATENHQNEMAKVTQERDTALKEVKGLVVSTAINGGMAAIGVPGPLQPAVAAMLREQISVIDQDGKRMAMVGDKTVTDHMQAWSESDEGKFFVGDVGNQGGAASGGKGAGTGGTPNPWAAETRNLTQQGIMERDNPTLAAKMKAESGVSA
jgi:hypothetical protein